MTIPNMITSCRLVLAPFLILVALSGNKTFFSFLFLFLLASDAIDGYLARKLNQITALGAKLDGWADLIMWISALISIWLLWPQIIKQELFFVLFALCAYLTPMIVGLIKFKKVPIYHCWSAQICGDRPRLADPDRPKPFVDTD